MAGPGLAATSHPPRGVGEEGSVGGAKSPRELAGGLVGAGTLRLHLGLNYSASVHV